MKRHEQHHAITAETFLVRGDTMLAEGRVLDAIACFNQAEYLGADADSCAGGRWYCWMLSGAYEQAWQESDAIRARGAYDPHRFWDGTPLQGRVLVRSLHGFGDAVQYLRYAPLIHTQAQQVFVQAAPKLISLLHFFPAIDAVFPWGEEPAWDTQVEVTELPYLFRSAPDNLPGNIPYMFVPEDLRCEVKSVLGSAQKPRVGLVWTGGEWDSSRSIPFPLLRELLLYEEVEFWSLQAAKDNQEWSAFCIEQGWGIRKGGEHSLEHLAGFIAEMDLIITIDSLAAHLAGALARPVWLMLKHRADWRWMLERDDSPWYPTMRLFRQRSDGDWTEVVAMVREALNVWCAAS